MLVRGVRARGRVMGLRSSRRRGPKVWTVLVICRELPATPDVRIRGLRVRKHRDGLSGSWCFGVYRTDHQPVVVHADEALKP